MSLRERLEILGHVAPSGTLAPAICPPVDLSRPGDAPVRRRLRRRERIAHQLAVAQLRHDRETIRRNSALAKVREV